MMSSRYEKTGRPERTLPPQKPRDNKSAEATAQAQALQQNAHAFAENAHLQNDLAIRPAVGHAMTFPSDHAETQGCGRTANQRESPPPVSGYGDKPEPEPRPVAFGLLSAPTGRSTHLRDPSPTPMARARYAPGCEYPSKQTRSPPPRPRHGYPLTPPKDDSAGSGSSAPSTPPAQNKSAYLQSHATGQLYKPLGSSEIRLIRIHPCASGPMKVTFLHTYLSNPHTYTALSYAWGNSKRTASIDLNGNAFQVTDALHGALRKLQCRDRPVLCWADALCINRKDEGEVTGQVQLMRDIYSLASSVSVWLGPSDKDSELAVQLLTDMSRLVAQRNEDSIRQYLESPQHAVGLRAVGAVFARPYWSRLLVTQEVLNAKYVVVHCGQATVPWHVFERAMDAFRRNPKSIDKHLTAPVGNHGQMAHMSPSVNITSARAFLQLGPAHFAAMQSYLEVGTATDARALAMKFLRALCLCRSKCATDPRDKVFGLLGVAPEEVLDHIIPDYQASTREVYTNVARYILTTAQKLDVICNAFHFPVHVTSLGLPSWVPDWSQISPMTAVDGPAGQFRAGGDSFEEITISDDDVLGLNALYVDRVTQRGSAVGTINTVHDLVVAFLHWFAILQFRTKTMPEATTQKLEEAFCRMLVFDRIHPTFPNISTWRSVTLHVFASLMTELMPEMPMHRRLAASAKRGCVDLQGTSRASLLLDSFSPCMTGRSLFFTENGIMGMASGYVAVGDEVVVPLGCSTPVLLRADEGGNRHRFVSDAYVDDFMYGRAVDEWKRGRGKAVYYNVH